MSEHFEENVRFVRDWASAMKRLCPKNEVEDFDWIIETLREGVHRKSEPKSYNSLLSDQSKPS